MVSIRKASRMFAIAVLLLCCFAPSSANALSCYGLSDKFFLRCSSQQCTVKFRAREIGSLGACARRVTVESAPTDVQSALLQRLDHPMAVGIYEVTLVHRYYGTPPVTGSELVNAFNGDKFRAPLTIKELDGATNLEQLEQGWVSQERWGFARMVAHWIVEISLLGACLAATYLSTRTYRRRLLGLQPGSLEKPIALQVAIFGLAIVSIGSFSLPALVGLVAPVLLVVWLYEAITYSWRRFGRRRTSEF